MQISTNNGANLHTSNYFKDFIQSENNNTNTNLKTAKLQENINYNYEILTKIMSCQTLDLISNKPSS